MTVSARFSQNQFDVKYVNKVRATTWQIRVLKCNQIFGTKCSKINQLKKTIEYKTMRNSENISHAELGTAR